MKVPHVTLEKLPIVYRWMSMREGQAAVLVNAKDSGGHVICPWPITKQAFVCLAHHMLTPATQKSLEIRP